MKQARLLLGIFLKRQASLISKVTVKFFLSDQDVAVLNEELAKEGFEERLENTQGPVFVVGQIDEMVAHPDSDHLNICQVNIGDKKVQIVAGAPNAALGLKTIVALPGAMMPSGALIFPGKLRGEDSYGMMCAPRELALPNAPQKRGIIELDDSAVVGETFESSQTLERVNSKRKR